MNPNDAILHIINDNTSPTDFSTDFFINFFHFFQHLICEFQVTVIPSVQCATFTFKQNHHITVVPFLRNIPQEHQQVQQLVDYIDLVKLLKFVA